MPNILLTTRCNLNCEYCFARERMNSGKPRHLSMPDLNRIIDFLRRSDCFHFRAMGGEPTVHPHFPDIVATALEAGMRVDLLSNATWGPTCRELFPRIPPSRLYFLLNIDHPSRYTRHHWARIERNLEALPEPDHVTLSFNLFEREPKADYIFELAQRYRIRIVRMSFSLPVLGGGNNFLGLEEYQDLVPFIVSFVDKARPEGIRVKLDNAVPLCIFSEQEAGRLVMNGVLDLERNSYCEPIIDIGPDLTVWCCFCISSLYNRKLSEFSNLQEIEGYYRRQLEHLRSRFVPMDKCRDCRYRELWKCQGGCITHSLMAAGVQQPDLLSERRMTTDLGPSDLVSLAEDVVINRYAIPEESYILTREASGIEVEVTKTTFGPLLCLLGGPRTVQQIQRQSTAPAAGGRDPDGFDGFVSSVESKASLSMLEGLLARGILVVRSRNNVTTAADGAYASKSRSGEEAMP